MGQKRPTGLGKVNSTCGPHEQASAQLPFKVSNPLAYSRLRDVQQFRCLAEVENRRYRNKGAKLA
jgi:hypothetical protein